MILIDDAGWGSMIGGVIIGAYREETGEFRFEEVPVKEFQEGNFSVRKSYLMEAASIALRLLAELKVSRQEPIKVCTGYCLDEIAHALQVNEFTFTRGKITGPLQDKIEHALRTVLETKYNFKVTYEELTLVEKKGLFWWKQVAWLKNGNPNGRADPRKVPLCKTGWATFDIWANQPYNQAKESARRLKAQLRNERRQNLYYD